MKSYSSNYVYHQLRFNSGLSWAVAGFYVLLSIEWNPLSFQPFLLALGGANILYSLLQQHLLKKAAAPDFQSDDQSGKNILISCILLTGLLTGNIFVTISAIVMLKPLLETDFIYAVYMVLVDLLVLAVTVLTIFKPFVANTFFIGFYGLIAILIFHLFLLVFHGRWHMWNPKAQNVLLFLLLLTVLSGNILALFVGVSFYRQQHSDNRIGQRQTSIREKLVRNYASLLGLTFIAFLIMIAFTSYITFSYSFAVQNNYSAILQSPTLAYPFGTDNFGRDVFSRIVFGSRISLSVGLLATAIPFVIGGFLGSLSGFYGNYTDNIIMRLLDVLYAIPGMLLAITIVASFGASTTNLIIALSLGAIPSYARTMRASVLQVANYDFIEAARALGQSNSAIILRHIVPNTLAPMIVRSTLTLGTAVIATSSLSFLGLGVESHVPEWGNILQIGSQYLETNPYLAVYPGLAIILLVLSFNFLGDGIRDATDPRFQ